MTERLPFPFSLSCIGEGNGNPLQCSCLENPRDGGACWAAVYGVTQSRTRLKRLSSSSSRSSLPPKTRGIVPSPLEQGSTEVRAPHGSRQMPSGRAVPCCTIVLLSSLLCSLPHTPPGTSCISQMTFRALPWRSALGEPKLKSDNSKDRHTMTEVGEDLFFTIIQTLHQAVPEVMCNFIFYVLLTQI